MVHSFLSCGIVQLRKQKLAQNFGLEYARVCGLVIFMPLPLTPVYCRSVVKLRSKLSGERNKISLNIPVRVLLIYLLKRSV